MRTLPKHSPPTNTNHLAAGGSKTHEPEDYGFMYQHGFHDLDGHGWGVLWMDPAAVQQVDKA